MGRVPLLTGVHGLALLGEGAHAFARVARTEDRAANLEFPRQRVASGKLSSTSRSICIRARMVEHSGPLRHRKRAAEVIESEAAIPAKPGRRRRERAPCTFAHKPRTSG